MATKKAAKKTAPKKASAKNIGPALAAGTAAAVAAAGAGAAAYYFYGTKNAKKHRQAASRWAKGLKTDVQKGVKNLKKVDAKAVGRVVDSAAAAYQGMRGVAESDVTLAVKELKNNWHHIAREIAPSATVKKSVKKATSAVKKAVKKVTPKKTAKRK